MIRRETKRTIRITEDLGIRLEKPHGNGAEFRPAWIHELLVQTDQGSATYTVEIGGPVQTKAGKDSQASSGRVRYGTGWGFTGSVSDIPSRIRGFLVGPDVLSKAIALPKDGAR